jgi:hypothetical protein
MILRMGPGSTTLTPSLPLTLFKFHSALLLVKSIASSDPAPSPSNVKSGPLCIPKDSAMRLRGTIAGPGPPPGLRA